jgi:hypothetical protein
MNMDNSPNIPIRRTGLNDSPPLAKSRKKEVRINQVAKDDDKNMFRLDGEKKPKTRTANYKALRKISSELRREASKEAEKERKEEKSKKLTIPPLARHVKRSTLFRRSFGGGNGEGKNDKKVKAT